ncbi:MAG: hypothetical protein HFF18_13725 [Oscillospiraceae bacterium]|nr:hypothetical protein [Oscillospiraceae bacterium]
MNAFLTLSKVQLQALLASLRVGGSRKKASSGWAALALICVLCLYVSGACCFGLAGQLAQAGQLDLLFLLIPAMAALAGLMFTLFAVQGLIFEGRDADFLLSMPVPARSVLLSKLTALYVENLVFCLFFLLPAGGAWLWYSGDGPAFVLRLLVGTAFLALLPTVLSLACGWLLSWFASRFSHKVLFSLLLYALMIAGVFFLAVQINLSISGLTAEALGMELEQVFTGWGLPFQLFQQGVCGNWGTLALFCLSALVPALIAAGLLAGSYQRVLTGLHTHSSRASYQVGHLNAASRRTALLKKEAARYFGTPIYLLNTGIGLIPLVVGGGAAAFMGGRLLEPLAEAGMSEMPLTPLLALVITCLLSTVSITGSSISLEGRNLWILKEAPVSARDLLAAKAGFQLLLTVPCLLIAVLGFAWGFRLGLAHGGILLLLGLAYAAFTALLGLAVNLTFPKLDAINDMVVVKQSAAALVSVAGGMAAIVVLAGLYWLASSLAGTLAGMAACVLALLAGCAALLAWFRFRGVARFLEL